MAMPFIFEKTKRESDPDRAWATLGGFMRYALDFAVFAAVALAILIAVAAIRVVTFLH